MRIIKFQLLIACLVGLITYGVVSIIVGKFSTLGLISGIVSFLITLNIDLLLGLKEISKQLQLERRIREIENPLLRMYAERVINKNSDIFKEIEQGVIRFDSEGSMMDAYYDVFLKEKSKRILATSMVSISHVWGTARGKKALEENKKASERGITIQRIFIFPNKKKRDDPKTQEHLTLQRDVAKVDVRIVLASELSPNLRKDFLVTDSDIVLEYNIDPDGNIKECILISNKRKAEKYREIYNQILAASSSFH